MNLRNDFELLPVIKRYIKNGKVDVDKTLALSYLCNDENLYKNSCRNFLASSEEISNLLNSSLESQNYIEAEKVVHRVKGYAYYIGSQFLYEFSSYLCIKIKNSDEKQLIKSSKKLNKELDVFINYYNLIVDYKRKELLDV